jgi:hypothetical protein
MLIVSKQGSEPAISAGYDLNDLYSLDPGAPTLSWTNLSRVARGTPPSTRAYQGFVCEGRKLYVFAGRKLNRGEAGWKDITPAQPSLAVLHVSYSYTAPFMPPNIWQHAMYPSVLLPLGYHSSIGESGL